MKLGNLYIYIDMSIMLFCTKYLKHCNSYFFSFCRKKYKEKKFKLNSVLIWVSDKNINMHLFSIIVYRIIKMCVMCWQSIVLFNQCVINIFLIFNCFIYFIISIFQTCLSTKWNMNINTKIRNANFKYIILIFRLYIPFWFQKVISNNPNTRNLLFFYYLAIQILLCMLCKYISMHCNFYHLFR